MLKRFLVSALSLLLLVPLAEAEGKQFNSEGISATQTNTAVTFIASGDVNPMVATKVRVTNRSTSANKVYVNFASSVAVASTGGLRLNPGETVTISIDKDESGWTALGLICAAAETATVDVSAIRVNP